MAEALALLATVGTQPDLVELRLDLFEEAYDLSALLEARRVPAIVTLRSADEGGRSTASAADRLAVLRRAAKVGAEYVDVEARSVTQADVADLRSAGASVIVSRHDFGSMPASMEDAWRREIEALQPDVAKLVGMGREPQDVLRSLAILRRANRPTIAIAMGQAGVASRVLCLREPSCFLTFAAWGADGTAPGQVSLSDMEAVYHAREVGPSTEVYALLGPHVDRDRLAAYNAWFRHGGLDAVAVPLVAADNAGVTVEAFRSLPVRGWHVHGEAMQTDLLRVCERVGPAARRQGKVNGLVERDGVLQGDWVESPAEQFALWTERAAPAPAGVTPRDAS